MSLEDGSLHRVCIYAFDDIPGTELRPGLGALNADAGKPGPGPGKLGLAGTGWLYIIIVDR